MKNKTEVISEMLDKFNELSDTSINTYALMNELYMIMKESLEVEVEMIDIETYDKLSEL